MRGLAVIWALPGAWRALRQARSRLRHSLALGLALDEPAPQPRKSDPAALARAVFGLGRRMRHCACLPQAIALANLLRARGLSAEVVLGAMRPEGGFAAHAWVEVDAQIYDPQPSRLAGFTRLHRVGHKS